MSRFSWRNGFAIGLTTGIAASLVLVFFGEELYNLGSCIAKSQHCADASAYEGNQEPEWWYWTRRAVAAEDTLAQWIMAFFTIAATVVLVLTLRSANKTNAAAVQASRAALESNQIMRNEQRPWLSATDFELVRVRDRTDSCAVRWQCKLTNHGATPAMNIHMRQDIVPIDNVGTLRGVLSDFLIAARRDPDSEKNWVVFPGEPSDRSGTRGNQCGKGDFGRFLIVATVYDIPEKPLGGADAQAFHISVSSDDSRPSKLIPFSMFRIVE